ncbi:hypothetical protein Taro_033941 [Colocasia esculenta]|uniref:Uncharacterized protein n=1 Tax=Colocasia esculenta TaxID=4460 RepID=A0A843VWI0_COLES|nr:hypothetical protein [Colocasia esculenta]
MEKYFGNPYRGDPGVPQTEPESFVNIWIGSFAFSAITWQPFVFNPCSDQHLRRQLQLPAQHRVKRRRQRKLLLQHGGINTTRSPTLQEIDIERRATVKRNENKATAETKHGKRIFHMSSEKKMGSTGGQEQQGEHSPGRGPAGGDVGGEATEKVREEWGTEGAGE